MFPLQYGKVDIIYYTHTYEHGFREISNQKGHLRKICLIHILCCTDDRYAKIYVSRDLLLYVGRCVCVRVYVQLMSSVAHVMNND